MRVFHAATLHKPHVATHARRDFVDTNITGMLNLPEEGALCAKGVVALTSKGYHGQTFADGPYPVE